MISEDAKQKMRAAAAKYPAARSALLPALRIAQEEEGYITPQGIQAVAQIIGVGEDEVTSVASFYTMFHAKPKGKHVIKVCNSIGCYLRGCDDLLKQLEDELGVQRGQTSADGLVTLETAECMASCGTAPVLQLNDEFVEQLTPERVHEIVLKIKQQ